MGAIRGGRVGGGIRLGGIRISGVVQCKGDWSEERQEGAEVENGEKELLLSRHFGLGFRRKRVW